MSDLTRFAEHCHRMATSTPTTKVRVTYGTRTELRPAGNIPDRERELWARLAAEIDTYLHHPDDDPATSPLFPEDPTP